MIIPLTEEQVLTSISMPFHAEYRTIRQTRLRATENIFAAANCSFSNSVSTKRFGFFILTDYRAVVVFFDAKGRKIVRYRKDWDPINFFSGGLPDNRDWVQPPIEQLSKKELKTRQIKEALLSVIGTITPEEYTIKIESQRLQILDLYFLGKDNEIIGYIGGFGDNHMAFTLKDGQMIYNLVQTAMQNGGRIEPTRSQSPFDTKESLRQQLVQHRVNLNKLKEQAAIYGVGEHPLSLLNKIENEQKIIEELETKLEDYISSNTD